MNHTGWLARRAALAIALMVGFYVLAVGIAVGLLWIPYAEWAYLDRIDPRIALSCVISAGALMWAVLPRPDKFEPPGPTLDEAAHHELFTVIREVAAATKQDMPTEVYLVHDVNAFVTHRGGIMGFGSHRVMGIGLPLLHGLTVNELRAVLAHEFGHYAAGDVKLGPWIYKTRAAIGRALERFSESWLSVIFNWYGHMFLRLTHAISREQEFLADALAARTVHPAAMVSALRRTESLSFAFTSYWYSEVIPALSAGYLVPITSGFEQYQAVDHISDAVTRMVATAESEANIDALDTHPPLRERVAALSEIGPTSAPEDPRPAAALIADLEAQAHRLLLFAAGDEAYAKLQPVDWNQIATDVYPRQWREIVAKAAAPLAAFTADAMPAGPAAFIEAGKRLARGTYEDDLRIARACEILSAAVAVALLDAGATVETGPGRPIVFRHGEATMDPFSAIPQLAAETLKIEEWQAQCLAIGIAGRPLAPAPRP